MAGMGALSLGALDLHFFANPLTTLLALLTAFAYVAVYTPLKRVTPLATFIGAFPAPWADAGNGQRRVDASSGPALRSSPFSWSGNFPHFMSSPGSIAKDYARAGIRMLPVVHPDGWSTVVQALVFAVLMIPVASRRGGWAWRAEPMRFWLSCSA